jgi:hypothetical protein
VCFCVYFLRVFLRSEFLLLVFCHFSIHFLSIFYPFSIHFLSIFYPFSIHFLSIFYPFSIHFLSIFYPFSIRFLYMFSTRPACFCVFSGNGVAVNSQGVSRHTVWGS